jgi:2-C-methyl-D-erythritol 4-phosphate cytidylyltransferase
MSIKDLSVVVVAGGSGTRMGTDIPKQFLPLCGKPVLIWSLDVFAAHPAVTEIVVVLPADRLDQGRELLAGRAWPVPVTLVAGGRLRQDSVWAGVQELSRPGRFVAIHDAARPGLDQDLLDRLLETARARGNAVPGIPIPDTMVRNRDGIIGERLDRTAIMGLQTPQIFPAAALAQALETARRQHLADTDESGLMGRLGETVYLVEGTRRNLKITSPEDLQLLTALVYKEEEGS